MNNRDQIIQRYLLGELTEAERVALEQEYFNDQQLFERMVEVENDLVDQHARGLLSSQTRERFQDYYLNNPHRRVRAQFAEALSAKLDQVNEVAAAPLARRSQSWWDGWPVFWRAPKLAWVLATVFLLTMAGTVWLLIEARRLREELAQTEMERSTQAQRVRELQQQAADERLRSDELSAELNRLRAQQPGQQTVAPSPTPRPIGALTFATLTLSVGGVRGAETGPPAVLAISPQTEQVRLQLSLGDREYLSYRAVLQEAGGKEIYAWRHLNPGKTKAGASLALIIAARRFTAGDYILTLRGVSRTGEIEDVSRSLFRVERK